MDYLTSLKQEPPPYDVNRDLHSFGYSYRYERFKRLWSRMLLMTFLMQPSDSMFRQFHNVMPYPDRTVTFSQIKDISWFLQIIFWPKGTSWSKGGSREERYDAPPVQVSHWLPPQSLTDTENWNGTLAFFLAHPPSPLVAIWQVEAKINCRRTQAIQRWVVWCRAESGIGGGVGERDTAARPTHRRPHIIDLYGRLS